MTSGGGNVGTGTVAEVTPAAALGLSPFAADPPPPPSSAAHALAAAAAAAAAAIRRWHST